MRCSSGNNRQRERRRTAGAFTLLEALVALLIAAAGFAGIFTALAQSQRVQIQAVRVEAELALAQSLIEDACLGLLPHELRVGAFEGGAERWQGVKDGMPWTVTIRSTPVRPSGVDEQATRRDDRSTRSDEQENPTYVLMDVVTCEVGSVTLKTVKW